MHTGCPSLAQELWNHILSFLCARTDLKACSVVSRALCAAAQSQLFFSITICPSRKRRRGGPPFDFTPATDEVKACRRLREILIESPHIRPHIRRIEILLHPDVLTEIIIMGLPLVQEIQFRTKTFMARVENNAVALAQQLMELPTVRRVELRSTSQTRAFLSWFFAAPPLRLETLEISMSELYWSEDGDEDPEPVATRRQIDHFHLIHSPTIARWLLHTSCPFDLTRITHADISSSMCADVGRILTKAKRSLRQLTLAPGDVDECVPLSIFPDLSQLHFDAPTQHDIALLLPLLTTLDPANGMREMTITLATHGDQPPLHQLEAALRTFDAIFDELPLPELQHVDIHLLCNPDDDESEDYRQSMYVMYVHSLPLLSARGILVVQIQ
ncbi:hypothetical protein K438DRAFT_1821020 [Mycena galopus ATCC 62051]|nr:hypothetical protein K438DRAFT_1821020 [Mycena galopus ATCC 62051]